MFNSALKTALVFFVAIPATILIFLFVGAKIAYGANIQIYPTIAHNSNGNVSDFPEFPTGNVTNIYTYYGDFDSGIFVSLSCSLACTQAIFADRIMEGGFANEAGDTSADGNYYVKFTLDGNLYYFTAVKAGGLWSGVSETPSGETSITGNYIPEINGAFITATSTSVTIGFDYISNAPVPTEVGIELRNITTGFQFVPQLEDVTMSGIFSFSTSTPTLTAGGYSWRAVLRGDDFDLYSPWRFFTIGEDESYQSLIPLPDDEEFGCEQYGWGVNTLCSFLAWAFIPSPEIISDVFGLYSDLSQVKPFGWFVEVSNLRDSFQISAPETSFPALPFTDEIFEPLRLGLATMLWAFFFAYLYNRFKHLEL